MEDKNSDFLKDIHDAVTKVLPKDVRLIYLSLAGSRGKRLDSPTSDYDIKAVIINSYDSYLLQQPKLHIKVDTEVHGKSLEGQCIDLTVALDYAVETNPFIMELLRAPLVYQESPVISETLNEIFHGAYNPFIPCKALSGILGFYIKKEIKNNKDSYPEDATAKALIEAIYVILCLRCHFAGKSLLQYFTIDEVMTEAGEEEKLFKQLVEARKKDKSQKIKLEETILKVLDEESKKSIEKLKEEEARLDLEELGRKKKDMREKADRFFLDMANKLVVS